MRIKVYQILSFRVKIVYESRTKIATYPIQSFSRLLFLATIFFSTGLPCNNTFLVTNFHPLRFFSSNGTNGCNSMAGRRENFFSFVYRSYSQRTCCTQKQECSPIDQILFPAKNARDWNNGKRQRMRRERETKWKRADATKSNDRSAKEISTHFSRFWKIGIRAQGRREAWLTN